VAEVRELAGNGDSTEACDQPRSHVTRAQPSAWSPAESRIAPAKWPTIRLDIVVGADTMA